MRSQVHHRYRKGGSAGRRPSLPEGLAGLLAALRTCSEGDDAALATWVLEKQPLLEDSLRAWGRSGDEARWLSQRLLSEAYLSVCGAGAVESEVPWMAGVIANVWSGRLSGPRREKEKEKEKERFRIVEAQDQTDSPVHVLLTEESKRSARRRILEVARALPAPYGHVLYWQGIHGTSQSEIASRLSRFRPVGRDRVACLVRQAHMMFRVSECGHDPRQLWGQRFNPKKNPWIATPLPPLPTQIQ